MKRKFLSAVFSAIFALFAFAPFFGCSSYQSKAGKLSELVGTYQLTSYTTKPDASTEEIDLLSETGAEAYLIVGENSYGYYVYKDNSTPVWCDSVFIEYTPDDEEPDLIKAIEYTCGIPDHHWTKEMCPGYGTEPPMGFNVKTKSLSYHRLRTSSKIFGKQTDLRATYKKVSDDTTLAFVENKLSVSFGTLARYELKNLDRFLVFEPTNDSPEYGKYDYFLMRYHATTQTADYYYKEKEGQAKEELGVSVPFVPETKENAPYFRGTLTIKGIAYEVSIDSYELRPLPYLNHTVNSEPDAQGTSYWIYSDNFNPYYGESTTAEGIIAELTQN